MSKSIANFTTGIVAGVIVGTTLGVAANKFSKSQPFLGSKIRRNVKKSADKITRNVGNVVSNVTGAMK